MVISLEKKTLKALRNNAIYKLFLLSEMTTIDFAKFWNLDRSQITRVIQDRREMEAKKKKD